MCGYRIWGLAAAYLGYLMTGFILSFIGINVDSDDEKTLGLLIGLGIYFAPLILSNYIEKRPSTSTLNNPNFAQSEGDWMNRLDAAEALARKNERRGLDNLNESLESSNADVREVAKEILSGLSTNSSDVSETSKPKIAPPTKIKTLTPDEIEVKQKRKESKKKSRQKIYRQKVLKAKGRCVICGEKLGIIDRFSGETYCPHHKATQ